MKNQYFGDINDYRKYGLIRALQLEAQLKVLVALMLTLNDQRRDGELRSYLREPDRWLRFDPELYRGLTDLLDTGVTPRVGLIGESSLLGTADYFSEIVPDAAASREAWAGRLLKAASESEFVFLDPDNGLEVPSRPLGRKGSSKYVYWPEVVAIWEGGASVLIYQHFHREKRETFVPRMVGELRKKPVPSSRPFVLPVSCSSLRASRNIHGCSVEVLGESVACGGIRSQQPVSWLTNLGLQPTAAGAIMSRCG